MKKILIIGDQREKIDQIESFLVTNYKVFCFQAVENLISLLETVAPDLILVGKKVGAQSGFDLIKFIRKSTFSSLPLILFSEEVDESSLEEAIDCGADDFISYPFKEKELGARVKAGLRRTGPIQELNTIHYRGLLIDTLSKKFFLDDKEIFLSPIEGFIMMDLVKNVNGLVRREELIKSTQLRGYSKNISLNVHICALRRKMGRIGKCIGTVHNQGYILSDNDFVA